MSNLKAEVTLDWGDGTYLFRLSVEGLIELEENCGAPFTVVYDRLAGGRYSIKDVRETLRLALIGGGKEPPMALALVRRYVDARPIAESWKTAQAALAATLFGFAVAPLGDEAGSSEGKAEAAPTESQDASTPPKSTETSQPWVSPLKQFRSSRFGNTQPH